MNSRTLKKHLRYMIPQMRLALIKEAGMKPHKICNPNDVEQFIEPLKHYSEEHFVAFHLDAKNQVMGFHIVSHGSTSASLVHPREVFKAAILSNAFCIIVAHNHPAGSMEPSLEDIETTESLIKAGKLMGVPVIDHIIVTSTGINSLRENYPEVWR
jgi:DNA repair protein RadC